MPCNTGGSENFAAHTKDKRSQTRQLGLLNVGPKRWPIAKLKRRKKYVSSSLVHHCWFNRGFCRQVGHASAFDATLDHRARTDWFHCRGVCHPLVYSPETRGTISSGRHYLFHSRSASGPIRLVKTQPTCLKCSRYF